MQARHRDWRRKAKREPESLAPVSEVEAERRAEVHAVAHLEVVGARRAPPHPTLLVCLRPPGTVLRQVARQVARASLRFFPGSVRQACSQVSAPSPRRRRRLSPAISSRPLRLGLARFVWTATLRRACSSGWWSGTALRLSLRARCRHRVQQPRRARARCGDGFDLGAGNGYVGRKRS